MEACHSGGSESRISAESESNLSVGSPEEEEGIVMSQDCSSSFNNDRDEITTPNRDNQGESITYDSVFIDNEQAGIDKDKEIRHKELDDLKIKNEIKNSFYGMHPGMPNFHGFGYDQFGHLNNMNGDAIKTESPDGSPRVLFNATQFAHGCQPGNEAFIKTEPSPHQHPNKSGVNDVQFRCNMCGKCFTHSCKLLTHQRYHNGEKPFKCTECGKCFTQRAGLLQHHRLHTGEKPFKCQECGKCFTQLAGVVQHQRTHTGEKPFGCMECGKSFSQRAGLIQHERLHTGEKPFNCLECGKCFTQLAGLNQHMRTHSGEKPFKCHICGKCYTQHAGLMAHMKSHSGDGPNMNSPIYTGDHQIQSGTSTPSVSNSSSDDLSNTPKGSQSDSLLPYNNSSPLSVPNYLQQSQKSRNEDLPVPAHLSNIIPNMQFGNNPLNMFTSSPVTTQGYSQFKQKHHVDSHPGFSPPYERYTSTSITSPTGSKSQKKSKIDKPFKCNICSKAYTQFAGLMIHQASHQPEANSITNTISAAVENIFSAPDGSMNLGVSSSASGLPFIPPGLYTPGGLLPKVSSGSKIQQGNEDAVSNHPMNMSNSLMHVIP